MGGVRRSREGALPEQLWNPQAWSTPVDQLVPAGNKLLDTFVFEHLDHVVVVDVKFAQPRKIRVRLLHVVVIEGLWMGLAMVLVGPDRADGHGVDRVGSDQPLHIEKIVVFRVLCRGRCPQWLLGAGSLRLQTSVTSSGKLLDKVPVGGSGVSHRGDTFQLGGFS